MKIEKLNIRFIILLFVAGLLIFHACKEEEDYPRTRLFQPVLNESLQAVDNTILVNLGKMKAAERYIIEVSRDTFLTMDYTFETDTNYVVINSETVGEELLWFTVYQVRVTAIADDPQYNSLPSFLGSVRTQKFPSNMGTPTFFDVLDNQAKVFWTPAGEPITGIKVYAGTDERLTTPLEEFSVTPEEREEGLKIIAGLEPSTTYQVAIFSNDVIRGWEVYTTREPLVSGDNVVNLTGIDSTVNLADILPDVEDGSVLLLEGGKTYLAGGYKLDKSVSFMSGYSFVPALPVIDCSSNFNIADGSNIEFVHFKDIHLTASADGFNARYVFNIDASGTIGEIKFESCVLRLFRGIGRIKGGEGTLDKFTITGCAIDSIRDYAIFTQDRDQWICNDILIENSTISKARSFLVSRNNSNSIVIDGCTIHETPSFGRQIFRWRTGGQDNVLDGITIRNTIWGHGWDEDDSGNVAIDGFDGLGDTNWLITNTYATSEFSYGEGKDEIPGFPSVTYPGLVTDLWTDPYNSIFEFKDAAFPGKGDSGDPRWRVGL